MRKFQNIRTEITNLSNEQIILKQQRKTIKFTGTRTVQPEVAAYKVVDNKTKLRHLFEAYAVLRGKERQICIKKEISKSLVDKFVEQYQE